MIKSESFQTLIQTIGFIQKEHIYSKKFEAFDCELRVDFKNQKLIYPEEKGFKVNDKTTSNFKSPENFVVFECVHRLLSQGYHPKHLELEHEWPLGHTGKSGKADIIVKDNSNQIILIIECKTAGSEYKKAINILENDSRNQLFSYLQQAPSAKFLALYASDFVDSKIVYDYYLINVKDNEELLKNNLILKSYKEAKSVEEKYAVWRDTYKKEYATIGLFENNQPYEIGKSRYSVDDLKSVGSKDIQGKYHQFATILRQHNISGRENAFDKLVNLFLCKVTDEIENPKDLKFYYKGMAYDDPFSFLDRLQELYKIGMEKFLDDKIVYIGNSQIDDAFDIFKEKPNVAKELIKEYFKELKFFTNNDFAFIDVHNEKLFYQNFEVLLKVVRTFEDIRLTNSEENQFLGDMFEGFLDQGIKQSEGQFFTPMPLVKFIISALPDRKTPTVCDYACGAGHFLNEYANINKESEITGIEKEYRLSKVAKVSSFMYGHEIEIIYADALAQNKRVKEESFEIIISNPPYSVKGFLTTLKEEDRERFELIKDVDSKSYAKTGAIECFFIERTKQLLKPGGIAAIIVPSSILNKDTPKLYTTTREIVLKYFEIVAIAEFGSGTFGKTGTNTVTLFLQKRQKPYLYRHFQNMVDTWFDCDFTTNEAFKDAQKLREYCAYIEVDFELYKALLCEKLSKELLEIERFKEYKNAFEKSSACKELKKKKYFKELTKEKQEEKIQKELTDYIKRIEREKLFYFMLSSAQKNEVVIIKSPTNNNEIKKFLGYEWSNRKGDEGIKYLTKEQIKVDEDIDEEDKKVLESLQGIKYINTPLYNPQNLEDSTKINKIIKENFEKGSFKIPDELKEYVSSANLVDMLDFSRVEFNKAFNLTPAKKVEIKSRWELVRLGDVVNILIGGTPSRSNLEYFGGEHLWVSIAEMNNQVITDTKEKLSDSGVNNSNVKLIPKNTTLLSFKLSIGKTAIAGKDLYTNEAIAGLVIKKENRKKIINEYLFYLFSSGIIDLNKSNFNSFGKSLNSKFLKNEVKIPLPPLDIQEKIVYECEAIDKVNEKLRIENEELKEKLIELIKPSKDTQSFKLGDVCLLKAGKFVSASEISKEYQEGLYPCYGGNGLRGYVKTFTHEGTYPLIGRQGALCGNVTLAKGKFHATEHAVVVTPKIELDIIWLFHKLVAMDLNQYKTGVAQPGLSVKNLNNVLIEIPPLTIQKEIVQKIEKIEAKIKQNENILSKSKAKKEEVLRKYL